MSAMEPPKITTEWVAYTPDKANALLDANVRNRNMRDHAVEVFARDMLEGHWQFTGEAIKVSATGVLLDGQHRLAAVVRAGELGLTTPVHILTLFGLPDEAQMVMDTGAARTASDALYLAGYSNPALIATTAKAVINLENGAIFDHSPGAGKVTHSEIKDWVENGHPEFPEFIAMFQNRARLTRMNPSAILCAHWELWNLDEDRANEFFAQLTTLEGLGQGSPVLALSRLIVDLKTKRVRLGNDTWIGMYFHAYNRWDNGQTAQFQRTPKSPYTRGNFPWPKGMGPETFKARERERDLLMLARLQREAS